MRKKLFWAVLVVLLFNLVAVEHISTGVASPSAKIYVYPPETKNVGVGSTFKVDINIMNAQNVFGWQINMTFNPQVVNTTFASITQGDFLSNVYEETLFKRTVNNTAGYVFVSCSFYVLPYPEHGADGDGWLASIIFKVRAVERGTLLQFGERTKLNTVVGGSLVPIEDFTTEDGIFDNRSPGTNTPPVASFAVLPVVAAKRGEVRFDASGSHDTDAWLVSYYWDYGDGHNQTFMREGVRNINLTTQAAHTYKQNGTYTVTLTVTDNNSTTATTSASVNILYDIAVVDVKSSHIAAMPGTQVTINVTVANNGNYLEVLNVTTYYRNATVEKAIQTQKYILIDPLTQKTLKFTWDTTGVSKSSYILKANVSVLEGEINTGNNERDIDGLVTISESNIIDYPVVVGGRTFHVIVNSTSSLPDFSFNRIEKKISFDVTGTGWFCNVTIPMELLNASSLTAWKVKFDGNNIAYTPTLNGTHYSLYINYTQGAHAVEIMGETVATPPIALFTPSKTKVVVGESISFDASASYDPDGTIQSWNWNFGDPQPGNTASGETVAYSYTAVGTYNVTLTVKDNKELTNSTKTTITVIDYPKADFTYSPIAPLVDETITFDATTSKPNGGSITSYAWNFGDGGIGTGAIVTHKYSTTGNYTVTLTINDSEELTGTFTETVTVKVHNIAITSLTASPSTVKIGESVTIKVTVTNKGNFTETFDVTSYYNTTTIETKSIVNLASENTQILTIVWNTVGINPSVYIIKAVATNVTGEKETDDNTFVGSTVTVEKLSSTLSISALPSTLTLGATTTINGTISPVRQGVSVTIQYRLDGGAWETLKTVITDPQGKYTHDWTPEKPGTYEIQASWQGDANTQSCQSQVQTVTVREAEAPTTLEYAVIAVAIIILTTTIAVYVFKIRGKKQHNRSEH